MFEYKVVPAPQRAVKVKGLKTTADRFAHTLAERINAEAAGGWEFLRTETLACEERSGFGRVRSSTQTVMVFARTLGQARPSAGAALAAVQADHPPRMIDEPPVSTAETRYDAHDDAAVAAQDSPSNDWHDAEPAERWEHAEEPQPDQDRDQQRGRDWGEGRPHPSPVPDVGGPLHAPARRQEPLFRSGSRLHAERPARAEPVVRPPRSETPDDEV